MTVLMGSPALPNLIETPTATQSLHEQPKALERVQFPCHVVQGGESFVPLGLGCPWAREMLLRGLSKCPVVVARRESRMAGTWNNFP